MFTTSFHSNAQREEAILVSFYGGKSYYREKAEALDAQLRLLSIDYDICEFTPPENFSWPQVCKTKISFYASMMQKHQRPIFWVDIDTTILSRPPILEPGGADFGAFLRNFKDLREFDPYKFGRLFHPGYLLFNCSPAGRAFLYFLEKIAQTTVGDVTDDYILQEGIKQFPKGLTTKVFSSSLLARNASEPGEAVFVHGDSGHVAEYKQRVIQHDKPRLSDETIAQTIDHLSASLLKAGKRKQCIDLLLGSQTVHVADPKLHARLLACLAKAGRKKDLRLAISHGLRTKELLNETLQFKLGRARGRTALRIIQQLQRAAGPLKNPAAEALLASRRYKAELDERAWALGIPDCCRPRVWWWDKPYPGNLGDIINPYLVEKISGIPPKFATKGPRIFACGSLLPHVKTQDITVWGAGSPRRSAEVHPKATFLAVRGPISREVVLQSGGTCPEIYGDPALLLPRFYRPKLECPPKGCGLILHHYHSVEGLPPMDASVELISILRLGDKQIEEFVNQLASKELILSTSLHGIIIAHAYGVPAVWCSLKGQASDIPGDEMKFHDYFHTVALEGMAAVNLATLERIGLNLASSATLPKVMPDLDLLLSVSPFLNIQRNKRHVLRWWHALRSVFIIYK